MCRESNYSRDRNYDQSQGFWRSVMYEQVCDMAISFESSSFLSVKLQRSDYINAGVLFSCVVREVFRTLPGHTRIRLILPTRFLAFLFQVLHLPQCMKTRHNNPRHATHSACYFICLCNYSSLLVITCALYLGETMITI